eukprot:347005-Pelagomonas_calceolata.AAC.3
MKGMPNNRDDLHKSETQCTAAYLQDGMRARQLVQFLPEGHNSFCLKQLEQAKRVDMMKEAYDATVGLAKAMC